MWRKKLKCPRRSDAGKNTLKELPKIFHDTGSTKDKMLKADINLEKSMTICQEIDKMLTPYDMFYYEEASTIQSTPDNYFTKK